MLTIDNLDHYYGQSHIIRGASLEIAPGSCTVLMGRNGVGKTTLLKCIMGLERPGNGSITLDGNDMLTARAEDRAPMAIGYVPQGREIFPRLTVAENLRTGLVRRRDDSLPPLVLELFPVLKEMGRRLGGDLSGGQQQQLAIGRALAIEPKLLILDEPTEGIQPSIVRDIGDIIVRLNREFGMTILLVEQKLWFARRVATDFGIMQRGQIVAAGGIDALTDAQIDKYLKV